MMLRSAHGVVVGIGVAVALSAGCANDRGDQSRSAPAPPASSGAALTAEPAPEPVGASSEREPAESSTGRPRPAAPVIGTVWTEPGLKCEGHFCGVHGAGTMTVHARVDGAGSVTVALLSTGTGPDRDRRILGTDRDGGDGWSVHWSYADEPLLAHLAVTAQGPGGTVETVPFGIYHPDRSG
jgi:hypothetical protein